jgi:hypothetical protein
MDGSGSDDDDEAGEHALQGGRKRDARSRVNAELRREQDALRKKRGGLLQMEYGAPSGDAGSTTDRQNHEAAGAAAHDYDGANGAVRDRQAPSGGAASAASSRDGDAVSPAATRQPSKYMSGLLLAASARQRERELRIERKVARELQAEEDADVAAAGEGRGAGLIANKDKFVTSGYRQKLRERELWQQEQAEKEREEQESDVTRRGNSSLAMASFYSNLNRNVAMGGGVNDVDAQGSARGEAVADRHAESAKQSRQGRRKENEDDDNSRNDYRGGSFSEGFEQRPESREGGEEAGGANGSDNTSLTRRQLRELKLEQARARYFERHPERRRRDATATT